MPQPAGMGHPQGQPGWRYEAPLRAHRVPQVRSRDGQREHVQMLRCQRLSPAEGAPVEEPEPTPGPRLAPTPRNASRNADAAAGSRSPAAGVAEESPFPVGATGRSPRTANGAAPPRHRRGWTRRRPVVDRNGFDEPACSPGQRRRRRRRREGRRTQEEEEPPVAEAAEAARHSARLPAGARTGKKGPR